MSRAKKIRPEDVLPRGAIGLSTPGDVVELVTATPCGGTMYGRTLARGTRLQIAWHQPREPYPEATFTRSWDEFEERFDAFETVDATAIVTPIREKRGGEIVEFGPSDEVDPLRRATEHFPLFEEPTP